MKKEAYEENNKRSGACSSPAKAFCRSYGKREKEKRKKKKNSPPDSGLSPTPQPLPHGMLGRKGKDVVCSLETRTVHFQNKACAVTCRSKFILSKGTVGGG